MFHKLIINIALSIFAFVFVTYPAVSQLPTSDSNERDNSELEISYEDLLNAAIYNNRGSISGVKEEWNSALQDFNRAIELDPNLPEAYLNRGLLYTTLEQWDNALQDFDRAIEIKPELDTTYIYRGYIYGLQKNFDKALTDLDRAISLDEQNSHAYHVRSGIYILY